MLIIIWNNLCLLKKNKYKLQKGAEYYIPILFNFINFFRNFFTLNYFLMIILIPQCNYFKKNEKNVY